MLSLCTAGCLAASAASAQSVELRMASDTVAQYYPWVTQFVVGPTAWRRMARDSTAGIRYRAAILTSEIFSTLIMERVRLGVEGCCATLEWAKRVDLSSMRRRFGMGPAIVALSIEGWQDSITVILRHREQRFAARVVDDSTLRVIRLAPP